MILKGSQRANGDDLAIHLMNGFDNEHVEIAEVYGTVAGDLHGAFAEMEVVARGTKAKNYLYSLSINPSSPLTREQYNDCIQTIEHRLGLTDQPRAVVFHVKDGREHCHVVWSKIDAENMKAIHMAYDHAKLCDLACELAHKYGLDLPPGLKAWEEKNRELKDKLEPTLAEKAQAEETGITPDQRRAEITNAYEQSDGPDAFINALEQQGYVLAQGDRRGYVIVDKFGNPHSLTRYVEGHKARDIRVKLAPLTPEDLPTVDEAKDIVRQRNQAREDGERERRQRRIDELRGKYQQAHLEFQEQRRTKLRIKEQKLLTGQQAERLSLHAAQERASSGLIFRVRSAVASLIGSAPGLRSVLGPIQKLTHLDPKEKQALEREALARRHARERQEIARLKRALAKLETRERAALEKKLRRAERLMRKLETRVGQDFGAAARDAIERKRTEITDSDLTVDFNDAAEFAEGADHGDDDDDRRPGWKARTQRVRRTQGQRRGKGYRYRRDD